MKINPISRNNNFKGAVYLNKKYMTVFDIELIQKESKKIIDLAHKKAPDFIIAKKNYSTMRVTAKLSNKELTTDVYNYNPADRSNNIQAILDTISNLSKNFK